MKKIIDFFKKLFVGGISISVSKDVITEPVLETNINSKEEVDTTNNINPKKCDGDCNCKCSKEVDEVVEDLLEVVELEVPTMKSTKGEIIAYLEAKGIEYKKSDTKVKLLDKL